MLEFDTAVAVAHPEESEEEQGAVEFTVHEKDAEGNVINSVMCTAYRPGDGQLAVLMASNSRHSSGQERVAGIINFFVAVLDDFSHNYIVNRLLDRRDPFGIDDVEQIMEGLIGHWTGRPTKSLSGSTPSPESTGSSSTPTTPALT